MPHIIDVLRQRKRVHSLHADGYTAEEIGQILGITERNVRRDLRRTIPLLSQSDVHRWVDGGICTPEDTEKFYPSVNGLLAKKLKAEAKQLCAMCPVRPRCRDAAFANYEVHGIWGGVDMSKVVYVYDERTGKVSAFQKVG